MARRRPPLRSLMLYGDGGFVPAAQYNFATALNDFTTLSSTSTMPTGGSISRAGNAYYFDNTGTLQTAATNVARFDNSWNGSAWVAKGLLVEGARTNVFLNSASPATQAITVTAQSYTLSFYGTGTITLSGASTAGPLVGTGANNRVTLTFTPSAGSLTLTLSGTITYPQLEAGSFASSYIVSGGSATTRNAETFSLTGYANRLVEAYYIDEETGANYSGNSALSTGTVTISPPTFGWVTSLRAYTNAYAGSISTPSWLSFSGTTGTTAGNRTYYDSTGTLTWAPANLLTFSNTFTSWTASTYATVAATAVVNDPFGGTSAYKLYENATAADVHSISAASVSIGTSGRALFSVYVKAAERTQVCIQYNDASVNYYPVFNIPASSGGAVTVATSNGVGSNWSYQDAGNGWYRISIWTNSAAQPAFCIIYTGNAGAFSYAGTVNSGIFIYGAQLEKATYATAPSAYIPTTSAAVYGPRYDYDPSTVPATPRGLLIEESRQNLLLQSQTINTTWSVVNLRAFGSGSVVDAAVAPDGTTTADLIVEDTTNNQHYIAQNPTNNNAIDTFSVYVKAAGRTNVRLVGFGTVPNNFTVLPSAYFNLATGAVTSSSQCTASIASVGNGWYRCVISANAAIPNTSATMQWNVYLVSTGTTDSYTGDGVSGVYVWGAQLEAGSFATSYIPSITGATRAPDVAAWTSAAQSSYFNAAAGTFGAQIIRNSSGGNNGVFEVPTSAGFNDLIFGNTNVNYRYGTGAVPDTIINTAFTSARVMAGYTASNFTRSVVANNGTVVTGTSSGASTYTGAGLYIGRAALGTSILNGHLQSFAYYNQRLPDAILKQKSSVNAPY